MDRRLGQTLTREKANSWYRLVVDRHNSHFTMGFLKYTCNHKIIVLCYPSHSTHIYQGLDAVVFSVLKWAWSNEWDKFERNGPAVSRVNFLGVYTKVHAHAFTKKNILAAFRKTGMVPFNPDVITEVMMAPSLETSVSTWLPFKIASSVQEFVDFISHHQVCKHQHEEEPNAGDKDQHTPSQRLDHGSKQDYTPVWQAMNVLASTLASFLVSNSGLESSSCLPPLQMYEISPDCNKAHELLDMESVTKCEQLLMMVLKTRNN